MEQQLQLYLHNLMIQEGIKNIAAGANPIILRRGMKIATVLLLKQLKVKAVH